MNSVLAEHPDEGGTHAHARRESAQGCDQWFSAPTLALSPTIPRDKLAQKARVRPVPTATAVYWSSFSSKGVNDAITILVPFADEGYARNRKVLRMPEKGLIRVNDRVGFHPALRGMGDLLQRGHLAIVPGVGYPNPNRSHFQSMAIWQTARLDPEELNGLGWIGRSLDERLENSASPNPTGGATLFAGEDTTPTALRGRRASATALERIEDLTLPRGSTRSLVQTQLTASQGPADDLGAFVRRSMLDAYT